MPSPGEKPDTVPFRLNGCSAWNSSSAVVQQDFPDYCQPKERVVILKGLDGGVDG